MRRDRFPYFSAASFLTAVLLRLPLQGGVTGDIVINEVHYDPPDKTSFEEFVELLNASGAPVDLSGWYFSDAIEYTIPDGTVLGPDEYLVIAENPEVLKARFGAQGALGPYTGFLSGDGDNIVLRNALGGKEDEVEYKVGFPWPIQSAGDGSSMELIHPSLDNDIGGSWRASGAPGSLPEVGHCILQAQDDTWHYRKGTSEASDPVSAWRQADFVEDASWLIGKTSIGIGDDDDSTVLADMQGTYTSVYLRRQIFFAAATDIPSYLKLRLYVDDGCIAWLNGVEVARTHMAPGDKAFDDVGRTSEAKWEEFYIANPGAFLHAGANMLAIHAFNASLAGTDFSIDAELCIPSRTELPPAPTPGARNSVYSTTAPPQLRQVGHGDAFLSSGAPFLVTAKVTDPEGVGSVSLKYQVVLPGSYIPAFLAQEPAALMARPLAELAPNPEFEDPARWTEIFLRDDGKDGDALEDDSLYTGRIPAQANRTLVRYRLTAEDGGGASVTVPYPDDPSLNFAAFVYDGVPSYTASKISVHPEGPGHVYPAEVMRALPVYFFLTRATELARCIAYNGAWQIPKGSEAARDAFNWEGAFVYDGKVYDHVHYRLRQANDRYGGSGKRSWRIRFRKGNYAELQDNYGRRYPTQWRTLNTGKMFDNKGVGNFGITETLNDILWNLTDAPAPFMHTFHFRVIDGPDEVPAGVNGQYQGDFWGMALAIEDYDPRFLDAHDMEDGNLYKLKDGVFDGLQLKRNQGRHAVTTDEDFQNIRRNLRPDKLPAWLDDHVNYSRWYPYHTVVEAVRHYDFVPADSHSKNRAWYFEPREDTPFGLLWTLPWDADASWGPSWNDGVDYSTLAIATGAAKVEYRKAYRNVIRAFRDLVWQEETIHAAIDDLAALVSEFSRADRDRWRQAPQDAGVQDFGTLESKVADMKKFAFVSWIGGTGPTVPAGGRAKHLDNLSNAEGDLTQIPATPTLTSLGPAHFPIDGLVFQTTPFSDPQGDDTFGGVEWRVAEVTDSAAPAYNPLEPRLFEWTAAWTSGIQTPFASEVRIPAGALRPGHAYRARVRMHDLTGRAGHWSAPVEFIASDPDGPISQVSGLRVTEVMYHPPEGGDTEFVEIQNIGSEALDLRDVSIEGGIQFAFDSSDVSTLPPGEYVLIVKNLGVFAAFYDTSDMLIAGEYEGRLDNSDDLVRLVYGSSNTILEFRYRDDWYSSTDGNGYSLVAADPLGPPESWNRKDGWRASLLVLGSPGGPDTGEAPEGLQVPGDVNQDAIFNMSDAIGLLGHLFLGSPAVLPCDGETAGSPGNQALVDVNGDETVGLTDAVYMLGYLFQGGKPPVLGTDCQPISGCPEVCAE